MSLDWKQGNVERNFQPLRVDCSKSINHRDFLPYTIYIDLLYTVCFAQSCSGERPPRSEQFSMLPPHNIFVFSISQCAIPAFVSKTSIASRELATSLLPYDFLVVGLLSGVVGQPLFRRNKFSFQSLDYAV